MRVVGWNPEALRRARRRYEIEHGDITQAEIGVRVARELGRPEPVSNAVVSYWFKGREPSYAEGLALARVLSADPWELGIVEGRAETKTPPHEEAASGDPGKARRYPRVTLPDEVELVRPKRRRQGKRAG